MSFILTKELKEIVESGKRIVNEKKVVIEINGSTRIGWHNFFENKVGTTGSAIPLLFLSEIEESVEDYSRILDSINSQLVTLPDGVQGWTTLAIPSTITIEGTVPSLRALMKFRWTNESFIKHISQWLVSIQQQNGGWNSNGNNKNPARIVLTCNAIQCLYEIDRFSYESSINKGIKWLEKSQNKNGSWGERPKEEGNVFYTAKVIKTLCMISPSVNFSVVEKAIGYVQSNIFSLIERYIIETYDISFDGGYNRLTLEHDYIAEILHAILQRPNLWEPRTVFVLLKRSIDDFKKNGFINPITKKEGIWTTIPISEAIYKVTEHYLPQAQKFWVLCLRSIILSDVSNPKLANVLYTKDIIIAPFRNNKRKLLFILAIITFIMLLILFYYKQLTLETLFVGFVFPIILFLAGIIRNK